MKTKTHFTFRVDIWDAAEGWPEEVVAISLQGEQIAAVLAIDRRYTAADYVVPPADCDRDSVRGARDSNRQGGGKH